MFAGLKANQPLRSPCDHRVFEARQLLLGFREEILKMRQPPGSALAGRLDKPIWLSGQYYGFEIIQFSGAAVGRCRRHRHTCLCSFPVNSSPAHARIPRGLGRHV